MKIRLEDIAKATGYTKGLVSRALAGKYNVGEEARDKIIRKAAELGYDYSKLRSRRSPLRRVLMIISSRMLLKEDYWQPILKSISSVLDSSMVALEYFVYEENNIDEILLNKIDKTECGAFIVIHSNPTMIIERLIKTDKPIVEVDPKYFDSFGITKIKFSNYDSIYDATKTLINLGHKTIAFYGSDSHSTSFRERHEGFLACISNHQKDNIKGVSIDFDNSEFDYADNELLISKYQKHKFTGLICANDIIALEAYRTFRKMGLSIPNDLSIIGFDNIKAGEEVSPHLSTFNVPREALGVEIAKYILGMFNEKQTPYSQIVIRCDYLAKESVKAK